MIQQSLQPKEFLEGTIEGDWNVLVIDRGPRENIPDPERFQMMSNQFQTAISAVEQGHIFNAMLHNGRAVASALGDQLGRKMCNDLSVLGCRGSSIGGSGPSLVTLIHGEQSATLNRTKSMLAPREWNVIETGIWKGEA